MNKEINGVNLSFSQYGCGRGKVLLLHGWGGDSSLMKPVADALQSSFQVLIPDLPGHGRSGRPPQPWGVPDYAECIRELIDSTGFSPCHVIAHSFGCRIATYLAAQSPSLFERIVFTGAAGIRPPQSAEAQKRTLRYKKLKGICDKAKIIPGLNLAAEKFENKLRRKYGSSDYNALDENMKKTFVKIINQDLSDMYEKFCSSTLLIWGSNDTETPLWMAKEMEKKIPDAGLIVFEGGSHFAYLEQISRFNTIVLHYLKGDE